MAMRKIEFLGKEYSFKRLKMRELLNMQDDIQESMSPDKSEEEQLIEAGKLVSKFLQDFNPEDMLEAEVDDFYIVQGLHLLFAYCKHNRSDHDINELKNKIIDAAIEGQLAAMAGGPVAADFPKEDSG